MYQGCNPTALHSQQLLLDALHDLLESKSYREITVSQLCQRSGVSRQTFYTLFGSKENLIRYQLERSALALPPPDPDSEHISLAQTCENYSRFVTDNYPQFQLLVENDLMDLLGDFLYRSTASCRQSFVRGEGMEKEYALEFMAAGLCRLTRRYILDHPVPDRQQLAGLALKILSGQLYRAP